MISDCSETSYSITVVEGKEKQDIGRDSLVTTF